MRTSITAGIAILALGLTRAEGGRWVRTAVTRMDGSPASTAFGPVQLTRATAKDIVHRGILVEERLRDDLLTLYEHVEGLGPGDEFPPTDKERTAYWAAVAAYWEHLLRRAGGDVELAMWYWRFGEFAANHYGGVDAFKAWARTEDMAYLERFEGVL